MEEQLISFETAKLAKEKGFGGKGLTTLNGYFRNGILCNIPCNNQSDFCHEDEFSAPTQSVLQKWLRDKHNIEVGVFRYTYEGGVYKGKCYMWAVDQYDDKYDGEMPESSEHWLLNERQANGYDFKTWEEALEQGLLEALKLIPNEKGSTNN